MTDTNEALKRMKQEAMLDEATASAELAKDSKEVERVLNLICDIRHGSMDDKQFRATVKHNLELHANARVREVDPARVAMLRQWINEDRIINNPRKVLVSNGEIMYWLTGDEKYLSTGEESKTEKT